VKCASSIEGDSRAETGEASSGVAREQERGRKLTPDAAETKSSAGRRTIGLPAQLVARLRVHRAEPTGDRERAGDLWHEGDWVFTTATGEPLNPNTDYANGRSCSGTRGYARGGYTTHGTLPQRSS
jgi:hypothetical protein